MNKEIESTAFDMHVAIGKIRTMSDTIRHAMYLDMGEIDENAQKLMVMNHEENCNLFAIMTDYIFELEEQITALNKQIS